MAHRNLPIAFVSVESVRRNFSLWDASDLATLCVTANHTSDAILLLLKLFGKYTDRPVVIIPLHNTVALESR